MRLRKKLSTLRSRILSANGQVLTGRLVYLRGRNAWARRYCAGPCSIGLSEPPRGLLRTHEALIMLSRTEHGVRLITTNFDNRFVEAGLEEQVVDVSPKLPVPKPHNWSTLVHLHGRILPGDDGENFVLTAADFGRAYLTERWAARFNH